MGTLPERQFVLVLNAIAAMTAADSCRNDTPPLNAELLEQWCEYQLGLRTTPAP